MKKDKRIVLLSITTIIFGLTTIFFTIYNLLNKPNQNLNDSSDYEEEIKIVKDLFTNEEVRLFIDKPSFVYFACGCSEEAFNAEELGIDNSFGSNPFIKCTKYNKYNEFVDSYKKLLTEEFYNSDQNRHARNHLNYSYKDSNDIIWYNYYEKDGILYALTNGNGTNIEKVHLLDKTKYTIIAANKYSISALVEAKWLDAF
ncbi:MAG: hypothetical protein ACI310_01970, partial [Bacilli bacterium]